MMSCEFEQSDESIPDITFRNHHENGGWTFARGTIGQCFGNLTIEGFLAVLS